jgi:proteasome-associated ATPase
MSQLEELLAAAKERLQQYDEFFTDLERGAEVYAVVEDCGEDRLGYWVDVKGTRKYLSVATLEKLDFIPVPGDVVLCDPNSGMPTRKVERRRGGLQKQTVTDVLSQGVLLQDNNVVHEVIVDGLVVEAGAEVLVTPEGPFIVDVLPKKEQTQYAVQSATQVTWDDIGGCIEAKSSLREAIETPMQHSEIFEAYGKTPSKGVLLYGPPGCGKTMLAKAAATSIAEMFGQKQGGFLYLKGPEVLSKWVGETEATIRSIFARARDFRDEHGFPAVLFIDEAEAILGRRSQRWLSSTTVPQFLSEMDGLEETGAFVLLATNRPDDLDSAVVRDGRIDRKVFIGRPGPTESESILGLYLKKMKTKDAQEKLQAKVLAEVFESDTTIYQVKMKDGESRTFGLPEILNGAMLKNIVENAAGFALRRDLESSKSAKATGITEPDIAQSVAEMLFQNRQLEHTEVLSEWMLPFHDDVDRVSRVMV